jgi:hypothetical protein
MSSSTLTVLAFGLLLAAALSVELVARRRRMRWPLVGDVFAVLASTTTGRFLLMLGWWWLGWHFFVR